MNSTLDKLIIVPGHAPFKDTITELPEDFYKDEHWVLQEFQKGEPPFYVEHIKAAAKLGEEDDSSLLVFSGGRTRPESKKWSEGKTYKAICTKLGFTSLNSRTSLEEFARDSFENLEFSLYQFYRERGRYPVHVTIAGWEFKRARFHLHAKTLGIPPTMFSYIGINNPDDLAGALKGEEKAVAAFEADPFGKNDPLKSKRMERNPFNDTPPYNGISPLSET